MDKLVALDSVIEFRKQSPEIYKLASEFTDRVQILANIGTYKELFSTIYRLKASMHTECILCETRISVYFPDLCIYCLFDKSVFAEFLKDTRYYHFHSMPTKITCSKNILNLYTYVAGLESSRDQPSSYIIETATQIANMDTINKDKTHHANKLADLLAVSKQPSVYFIIEEPFLDRVLIGHSFDVPALLVELQPSCTNKLKIKYEFTTPKYLEILACLHKRIQPGCHNWRMITMQKLEELLDELIILS